MSYPIRIAASELEEIKRMYYLEKMSAREIASKLKVSLHTVYRFMRRHKLSLRSPSESNAVWFAKTTCSFRLTSPNSHYLKDLKAIGVMLYWAEGAKYDGASMVDFANSDPAMIVIFLNFLRNVCGVNEEKLRIYPYFYSNQNIKDNLKFWQTITGIPQRQFTKPYIRTDYRIQKKSKMPFGMIHVRYSDKKLLLLIKDWINEYKVQFTRAGTEVAKRDAL